MPEQDLLIRVAQGVKAEDAVRAIDTIEFARTLEHSSLVRPGSLAKVVLMSGCKWVSPPVFRFTTH